MPHPLRRALILFGLTLLLPSPAPAFIENLTPLKDFLEQADFIFLAKVEAVDPDRPSAILTAGADLKGKSPFRRLAINLTGDKEKHTPQLLKRIAPELPVIVLVTDVDDQLLGLVYTNGCWFQILGKKEGANYRWSFTHIEIYLRRTFKGTTAEMEQTIRDALSGKMKPPAPNAKEPAGFGPEIEKKSGSHLFPRIEPSVGTVARPPEVVVDYGVVALTFLGPIAAILQLLFPGLLAEQWRQYRILIYTMLTQTTILFVQWLLSYFNVTPAAWLPDIAFTIANVATALVGLTLGIRERIQQPDERFGTPVTMEWVALGVFVLVGAGWSIYQAIQLQPMLDEMTPLTVACVLGCVHLIYRQFTFHPPRTALLSTQLVALISLVLAGTAMGIYVNLPAPSAQGQGLEHVVTSESSQYRGNAARTGCADPKDQGPSKLKILWSFEATEKKGKVIFHSSPTVANGLLYIGAMYQIFGSPRGRVYCIHAQDLQDDAGELKARAGELAWGPFKGDDGSLKPVFAAPIVAADKVYFGEGYHENQDCRLFCLHSREGKELWTYKTTSHVESSPALVGDRILFGAGDDGIYALEAEANGASLAWQTKSMHVDGSPLIVGDRVYAGSIVGDRDDTRGLFAVAIDHRRGENLWRVDAPMPVTSSAAFADGKVVFGLGYGKFNTTDAGGKQAGALWCLAAETGQRLWEFRTGDAIFSTPALAEQKAFTGCKDGFVYAVGLGDGELAWKQQLDAPIVSSPAVAGGKVFVMTVTGTLWALDANSGDVVSKLDEIKSVVTDHDAFASPTIYKGRIYVAAGNRVFCVGESE